MKKIMVILSSITIAISAKAQTGTVYDDLYLGPVSYGILCNQALSGYGWAATHGSPSYEELNTTIYMFHDHKSGNGEGVYKSAVFTDGGLGGYTYRVYEVTLGIKEFKQQLTTGDFEIWLTSDAASSFSCSTGGGGQPIPTLSSTSRFLYSYNGNNPYGNADLNYKKLVLRFFLNAGESYDKIVIYPKQLDDGDPITLTIDYLNIFNCDASNDRTFCDDNIDPDEYFQTSAYIGTSYCENLPAFTKNDPYSTTIIHSTNKIEIRENTDLSVDTRGSGLVILDHVDACPRMFVDISDTTKPALDPPHYDFFDDKENEEQGDEGGKPAPAASPTSFGWPDTLKNSINEIRNMKRVTEQPGISVEISPNPAKNTLTVKFYTEERSYSINILDLSGRNILSKNMKISEKGNQKTDLDISKLSPGSYLLELTTENGKTTRRFAVSR